MLADAAHTMFLDTFGQLVVMITAYRYVHNLYPKGRKGLMCCCHLQNWYYIFKNVLQWVISVIFGAPRHKFVESDRSEIHLSSVCQVALWEDAMGMQMTNCNFNEARKFLLFTQYFLNPLLTSGSHSPISISKKHNIVPINWQVTPETSPSGGDTSIQYFPAPIENIKLCRVTYRIPRFILARLQDLSGMSMAACYFLSYRHYNLPMPCLQSFSACSRLGWMFLLRMLSGYCFFSPVIWSIPINAVLYCRRQEFSL